MVLFLLAIAEDKYKLTKVFCDSKFVCFWFDVAINHFSVMLRRCLVAKGSSMLTVFVLPHLR